MFDRWTGCLQLSTIKRLVMTPSDSGPRQAWQMFSSGWGGFAPMKPSALPVRMLRLSPQMMGPFMTFPRASAILLRLLHLPQTKSNQTTTADVVLAYSTLSGFAPGLWCQRVATIIMGSPVWPHIPGRIIVSLMVHHGLPISIGTISSTRV